ncbi:hypothetical protein BP6252_06037 [Coleophoma cylindrospora]|uniref:Alpha-L-rhamnosidase six-hairpin glycosidase domain-containing protein n=1 Tax=Coleophoma cylindrospora TaxID=1849047 RepID=A0A3D8RLG3_9HELO|nr:hypothetical protein BP6252_06037 [Coleophoma cylindrospora]
MGFLILQAWLTVFASCLSATSWSNFHPRNNSQSQTKFLPIGIATGQAPSSSTGKVRSFELVPSTPFATLDYGTEVAGYPFFEVSSMRGKVQIEVKYGEAFQALSNNFSDGPYPFAIGLSNTYRVETFDVTTPGIFESFFLQGGQRWQSIRLLTPGSITFASVGLRPSIPVVDIDNLPGQFECDNNKLNDIWKLGAKAVNVACLEQGTQPELWQVNQTGAFIRGMRSGVSDQGAFLENYTLEFDARIERGGLGWVVAHPLASPASGIQLNLVGELPPETRFVNTNTSLTPPNSILLGYGYSIVNQTTLNSYLLDTFQIPFPVQEKTWYRVTTVLTGGEYLAVSISGIQIFNATLSSFYIGGSAIPTRGSFGFGGWQDQSGTVKNVLVYDTLNSSTLYSNPMTDKAQVLAEYGVHQNYESVCLDGPKRDRLIWLGDLYHTSRIVGTSTSRLDLIKGTLNSLLSWQTPDGLFPYDAAMGYNSSLAYQAFTNGGGGARFGIEVYKVVLPDYQILGLLSFTDYVSTSNDLDFVRETWPHWKLQTNWILDQINATTGLLSLLGAFLGPASGGSVVNCAFVQALNMVADIAAAIDDTDAVTKYQNAAITLAATINKSLWNSKLGVYSLSLASPDDYSVSSCAFCITSGTANATQASSFLAAIQSLKLGPGYKDSTQANSSDPSTNISPNTNGFFLAALMAQGTAAAAATSLELLQTLWGAMLVDNETKTGASWEYLNVAGAPGLGLYTSLSHPWGGAPTYLLTEWVAGLQAAAGAKGFGYGSWVVNPTLGVAMGLGKARATVMTAFSGSLEVAWSVVNASTLQVQINAPARTSGVFEMAGFKKVLTGGTEYHLLVPV